MNKIVFEKTEEFIINRVKRDDECLTELEEYAKENSVPIVTKEVSRFLEVMTAMHKPVSILEVGCAIGYSAILFAKSAPDAKITTVERNPKMIEKAKSNLEKYGFEDRIEIIEGDALEVIKGIDKTFDMVFIDAGKGHYLDFFNDLISKVRPGGLIISDNVLYKGMIADEENVVRRKKTIVKRMRSFLDYISTDERLLTSIIPMGDGVAISYVKEEK